MLYIDAMLETSNTREVPATFGPFSQWSLAEQALLEVMRRADVRGALIGEEPDA